MIDLPYRAVANDAMNRSWLLVLLAGIGVVAIPIVRRRWRLAVAAAAAMIGAVMSSELLGIMLERPPIAATGKRLPFNTFPSGHATMGTAIALGLLLVTSPRRRGFIAPIAILVAGIYVTGVLLAAWHRPSDMLGGLGIAACWAFGAAAWLSRFDDRPLAAAPDSLRTSTRFLFGLAFLLLVPSLLAVAVDFLTQPAGASRIESQRSVVVALGVVNGAVVLSIAVFLRLWTDSDPRVTVDRHRPERVASP